MVHRYTKLSTSIGCEIAIEYSRNCCMLQNCSGFSKQLAKISSDDAISVGRLVVWRTKVVMHQTFRFKFAWFL